MVYRGERMYPGRRERVKPAAKSNVSGMCIALILAALMLTSLAVSYSRLVASKNELAAGNARNVMLTEQAEFYENEIRRLTGKDEVTRRAEELGLIEKKAVASIEVPVR